MDRNVGFVFGSLQQAGVYIWELVVIQGIIACVLIERLFRVFVPRALKSLKGEVILVTGAGNGIGREIALNLGNLGARIVCWDVDSTANELTVQDLTSTNTKAYAYTVDLSKMEDIKKIAATVKKEVGEITIVINNAGIIPNGPFLEMQAAVEEKMFRVNVLSHFEILRQFLPKMIERNHGHVVTIASLASFLPSQLLVGYSATKSANYGFIESLKQELDDLHSNADNIHFTTVYPCFVQTRNMAGVTLSAEFPSNFPVVTPEFVGRSTVEAMRRNIEHFFIPKRGVLVQFLRAVIPTEVKRRLNNKIFKVDITRNQTNNYL